MSFISTLKLTEYKPQQVNGGAFARRRKLLEKLEQQIQLATNPDYAPSKTVWVQGEDGIERKVEVAKRVKRWWVENLDGTVTLTVRYGSRPIELAKGKNAIELAGLDEVGKVLVGIKQAAFDGELDTILTSQAFYARKKTVKAAS
jgi:hypothetical protein